MTHTELALLTSISNTKSLLKSKALKEYTNYKSFCVEEFKILIIRTFVLYLPNNIRVKIEWMRCALEQITKYTFQHTYIKCNKLYKKFIILFTERQVLKYFLILHTRHEIQSNVFVLNFERQIRLGEKFFLPITYLDFLNLEKENQKCTTIALPVKYVTYTLNVRLWSRCWIAT